MAERQVIAIGDLRVGMYVHLDLKWFEHPFAFSHFKIKDDDQIREIAALGLRAVSVDPELSDASAQAPAAAKPVVVPDAPAPDGLSPVMRAKRALMEQVRARREEAERVEKAFIDTAQTIRDIEKNLYSQPEQSLAQANKLVNHMVEAILGVPELAIQFMGDRLGGEELYFHSLNVTMLSLMVARAVGLPAEAVGVLGIGALLHDVGQREVPDKILRKTSPMTPAERHFYEMHCQFGVDIGKRLKLVPGALAIIAQHHEFSDGTGFPAHLKGDAIGLLARIVVIANHYDELCNPVVLADALTPHEALSLMFSRMRSRFDARLLQVFIRCLGVYPPGTIVQLSNGTIAMVTNVNTAHPMKPVVMVYDASIAKEEALLLDMDRESEVNIAKAIRPVQVSRDVYNYLSPRKRVSYYFDGPSKAQREARP